MHTPWTTAAILARAAALGANRTAAVMGEDGASLTYGELDARATRFANALRAHGIGPGERVAVLMENHLDYLVAYHGTGRARAVFVPIVTQSKLPEIEYFISHAEPALLLVDGERWRGVAQAWADGNPAFASLRHVWLAGDGRAPERDRRPPAGGPRASGPAERLTQFGVGHQDRECLSQFIHRLRGQQVTGFSGNDDFSRAIHVVTHDRLSGDQRLWKHAS